MIFPCLARACGKTADRTRLRPSRHPHATSRLTLVFAMAASLSWLAGCGLDGELPPNPVDVVATRVSTLVPLPGPGDKFEERRRLVDGVATDPEWNEVPYIHIAMGPENGNGGGSFLAAVKVAHDGQRLYMLVQWPDTTPDRLGPRLVWSPDRTLAAEGCDSLLVGCSWTLTDEDEDRMAIMWDMGARDGAGTFRDRGCQVACHGNMHPLSGAVDIWQWRAARTNPIQFPLSGSLRVGFADDGYADGGGRVDDPGLSFFRSNVQMVDCGGRRRPRPLKIADALSNDGRPTIADNDFMLPCDYIFDATGLAFTHCSREDPCRQFEQEDVLDWVEGDDLSATLLNRPANVPGARRSRHDVEARGKWDEVVTKVWSVELSRILTIGNPEDIDFDLGRQEPYTMAIAIMNNSGKIHAGSPPIQVHF